MSEGACLYSAECLPTSRRNNRQGLTSAQPRPAARRPVLGLRLHPAQSEPASMDGPWTWSALRGGQGASPASSSPGRRTKEIGQGDLCFESGQWRAPIQK